MAVALLYGDSESKDKDNTLGGGSAGQFAPLSIALCPALWSDRYLKWRTIVPKKPSLQSAPSRCMSATCPFIAALPTLHAGRQSCTKTFRQDNAMKCESLQACQEQMCFPNLNSLPLKSRDSIWPSKLIVYRQRPKLKESPCWSDLVPRRRRNSIQRMEMG